MFSSLRTRLWLSYALQIILALGLVFLLLLFSLLRSPLLYRGTLERMNLAAEVAVTRYADLPDNANPQAVIARMAESLQVRLAVLSADGEILFDSQAGAAAFRKINLTLQPQNPPRLPLVRDSKGRRWLYTSRPLPGTDDHLVVLVPMPSLIHMSTLTDDLLAPFLRVGIAALLLSLGVAWLVARGVADPLQEMVKAAQAFPDETPTPVSERGPQEVREVIQAFNAMAERVQASQQAQREFVANVSHELKTPLTSIQGFAQAILDGTADDPQTLQQAASIIRAESARMYRMVLDLLDLARMDAGIARFEMRDLDLRAILKNVLEKLAPQSAAAGVRFIFQMEAVPPLRGDGDRLSQVFTNLIENALKHTPAGGAVTIAGQLQDGFVQVTVQDTGEGIPPEALPHIFERFYRADAARQGGERQAAGLGLAIAHDIVRAHGGKISVQSAVGQGSTFIVHLPLAPPDATTLISKSKR